MDYEKQAHDFLARTGLRLKIQEGEGKCPPWDEHKQGCCHGRHYRVTLSLRGHRLTFDYWGSIADNQANKAPTSYSVLACISSNAAMSADPDEVAEEMGEIKPSLAIAIAKFAKRLQQFFTEKELALLQEIQ